MSAIQWTQKTWNPTTGCSLVSPGCANCYAMKMARRLEGMGQAKYAGLTQVVNNSAVWTGEVRFHADVLALPLRTKKPTLWFVNSMSDLFHDGLNNEQIDQVFAVMALCPQHTFQVLTKRPERMLKWLSLRENSRLSDLTALGTTQERVAAEAEGIALDQGWCHADWAAQTWPLPNVWLGVSVEDQKRAEERIPFLLSTPATVRFLSCEPLLTPLDLSRWLPWCPPPHCPNRCSHPYRVCPQCEAPSVSLHWVIVGGESGPRARPFDVRWAESLVQQCQAARVPVFVKQLGARPYQSPRHDGATGCELRLSDRKGGDPQEWPESLRVREMPRVTP